MKVGGPCLSQNDSALGKMVGFSVQIGVGSDPAFPQLKKMKVIMMSSWTKLMHVEYLKQMPCT